MIKGQRPGHEHGLQELGVVEVHRVTVKSDTEKVTTNTLFLTFNTWEMPKEITVGYLKVKVALFVPNPMRCFNCNKFGHTSQRCKVAAKCQWCGKDKHEGWCEGPKLCSNWSGPHTSLAQDWPVWQKEIQHICVEKRISFLEARQLVEAKMLTVVSGSKSYVAAASIRKEMKTVECQLSLMWVFFRASTQDSSIFSAFLWWAWISIGQYSGLLWEVKAGISQHPDSVWSSKEFRDS